MVSNSHCTDLMIFDFSKNAWKPEKYIRYVFKSLEMNTRKLYPKIVSCSLISQFIIKIPPHLNKLEIILRLLAVRYDFAISKSVKSPRLVITYKMDHFHFILKMFECRQIAIGRIYSQIIPKRYSS